MGPYTVGTRQLGIRDEAIWRAPYLATFKAMQGISAQEVAQCTSEPAKSSGCGQ